MQNIVENNLSDTESQSEYEIRKVQGLMGEYSFSVVLPKSYAMDIGIEKGDYVKVYKKADALVIKKA